VVFGRRKRRKNAMIRFERYFGSRHKSCRRQVKVEEEGYISTSLGMGEGWRGRPTKAHDQIVLKLFEESSTVSHTVGELIF
jgi:hypothetical protein